MKLFDPVSITTYTDMTGLDMTWYRKRVHRKAVHMISPQLCGFQSKHGFRYGWMYRVRTDTVIIGKTPLTTPPQMKRDIVYMSPTPWGFSQILGVVEEEAWRGVC